MPANNRRGGPEQRRESFGFRGTIQRAGEAPTEGVFDEIHLDSCAVGDNDLRLRGPIARRRSSDGPGLAERHGSGDD
jgi:hypothetical protein